MMKTTVEETAGILKRLTPQNQAYFMTLVRVAEIAENGAKNVAFEQFHVLPAIIRIHPECKIQK